MDHVIRKMLMIAKVEGLLINLRKFALILQYILVIKVINSLPVFSIMQTFGSIEMLKKLLAMKEDAEKKQKQHRLYQQLQAPYKFLLLAELSQILL